MNGFLTCKGVKKYIKVDWEAIGADTLLAGTPIGADGATHNDTGACGIVIRNITKGYESDALVLVSGWCDKDEAAELSGITLSNAALLTLDKITFISEDGTVSERISVAVAG